MAPERQAYRQNDAHLMGLLQSTCAHPEVTQFQLCATDFDSS